MGNFVDEVMAELFGRLRVITKNGAQKSLQTPAPLAACGSLGLASSLFRVGSIVLAASLCLADYSSCVLWLLFELVLFRWWFLAGFHVLEARAACGVG